MSLFNNLDYRAILKQKIFENHSVRGYQSRLAEAARCQTSYLSRVLNTSVQLTPDQAAGICQFWNFNDSETEYFLTLVHRDRTSFQPLQRHYDRKLDVLRKQNSTLSAKLKPAKELMRDNQATYYSSWEYAATHMLLSITGARTPAAVSRKLRIPLQRAGTILDYLSEMDLVEQKNDEWKPQNIDIHISSNSPFCVANHLIWRSYIQQRIQQRDDNDVHYTSVYTLTGKDLQKLRAMIVEFIAATRSLATASPRDEELVCFCLDFFAFD